jgi:hypothetical protein
MVKTLGPQPRTEVVIILLLIEGCLFHPLMKVLRIMKASFRTGGVPPIPTDSRIARNQPVPGVLDNHKLEARVKVFFTQDLLVFVDVQMLCVLVVNIVRHISHPIRRS